MLMLETVPAWPSEGAGGDALLPLTKRLFDHRLDR